MKKTSPAQSSTVLAHTSSPTFETSSAESPSAIIYSGRKFGLRRGLSLLPAEGGTYHIGRGNRRVAIRSPFARTAVIEIAQGRDPFCNLPVAERPQIEQLIASLAEANFLTHGRREIALPPRYLGEIVERDLAAQQLRNRCEPELLQCEWSGAAEKFGHDEGAEILSARANARIVISGRNRIATLLHSLLLASGVSGVELASHSGSAAIQDCDIGTSTITAKEFAESFYNHLASHRRDISLFPLERRPSHSRLKNGALDDYPALIIHVGPVDIEDLLDWLTSNQPHFLIQSPIADEITMGPLVLPGLTPCLRCADLNQIDRAGYSSAERISLTDTPEIAMVGAHFVASLAASQVLDFIDSGREVNAALYNSANSPISRSTTVNLQDLLTPQIHSVSQHPLCGCQIFHKPSKG